MWWEHLDNIRKRPDHVRRRIALVSTSVIFLLIFSVWYSTRGLATPRAMLSVAEVTEPLALVGKAFGGMRNQTEDLTATLETQLIPLVNALATTSPKTEEVIPPDDPTLSDADMLFPEETFVNTPDPVSSHETELTPTTSPIEVIASTTIIN